MAATRRAKPATAAASTKQTTDVMPSAISSSRTSPFLPTFLERIALGLFPALLIFGTIFSIVSPTTRSKAWDHVAQTHMHEPGTEPSYFARKSNVFNVYFVKIGWAWQTAAVLAFAALHPAVQAKAKAQAVVRWALVTGVWVLVTQWCFGPAIIDRGFRWTGGMCDLAEFGLVTGTAGSAEMFTAVACKASGGKWKGGHDISGHVFLLVLGSGMLMNEVGWAVARWTGWASEERRVVMADGAVKSVNVEAEAGFAKGKESAALGLGGKFALGVLAVNLWMLLMTAIYFHTWFEKVCFKFKDRRRMFVLTCCSLQDWPRRWWAFTLSTTCRGSCPR